jgi:hypothetical protein
MLKTARTFAFVCLLLPTGCVASVGTAGMKIPESAPQECSKQCSEVGMELGAIVTMAGSVGCVCSPEDGTEYSDGHNASASAAGGMAAILLQRQQQQQQQQNVQSSYTVAY